MAITDLYKIMESSMRYKRVAKIDFDFSVIGYGCWGASGSGSWTGHSDDKQIDAIRLAIDSGVNFFDVAPIYGMGHAEEVLGKAIKGRRDGIFIATKAGIPWNGRFEARNDVTADSLLREIDQSLERLNTHYVDLLQVHWPTDSGVALEETMNAMRQIKESGKAKYIGLSNYSLADIEKASKIVDIVSFQGLYNMIEQDADSYHNIPLQYRVSSEILPFVEREGMACFPYSPLFQGLLTGKINANTSFGKNDVRNNNPKLHGANREFFLDIIGKIEEIQELKDRPLNQIAMNYLVAKKSITSVIATVENRDELLSNIDALEWNISQAALDEIDRIVDVK